MPRVKRKFVVFQDEAAGPKGHAFGAWRWHCKSSNGKLVYTAGESFDSKRNAVNAARREMKLLSCTTALEVQE